jgi:hypothetical protein
MLEGSELLSTVGVDYSPLRDLLASGQWKKADEETGAIMLKISGRVAAGWLREEDIETFPCADLQTIDSLWLKSSSDRFGFTAQCHIWESVGQDYGKFGDTVGWRSQQRYSLWYHYSELDFSLNAPTGHLPAAPFFKFCELAIGWTATLPSKLADCCVEDF